jgi:hypothetical protein
MKKRIFPFFILFCIVFLGCGHSTVSVSGIVTLNGKPIGDCVVRFQPKNDNLPESVGLTDATGHYSLKTFGEKSRSGAVPGEYRVTFSWQYPQGTGIKDDEPAPTPPYSIPEPIQRDGLPYTVSDKNISNADFNL